MQRSTLGSLIIAAGRYAKLTGLVIRISVAITALLGLVACSAGDSAMQTLDTPVAPVAPAAVAVEVYTLQAQTWQGSINAFGVIEALEEVTVAAELSGTVKAVHVNEGDRVVAGQLLMELDAQKRELALQQVKQQAQQARTALQEARQKLERRLNLAERKTISKEILDTAQLAVDSATSALRQALASEQLAERELADTRILSPTPGLVDIKTVEVGEPVQAGARLFTLQAVQSLRVHTWVSEADIANIRAGGSARVAASGLVGSEFQATVEWVGVNADPATGNFPVKLILTDPAKRLRPGMTASVILDSVQVPNALLLPESALVDRNRRRVVFVVEDGVAQIREPLLAAGFSNRLHIIDGLSSGDRVITSGQALLLDGTQVVDTIADSRD